MQMFDIEEQESTQSSKAQKMIDWGDVLKSLDTTQIKAGASKPLSNNAQDILDSWTVVEALSPEGYKKPEKLASDQHGALVHFRAGREPWVNAQPAAEGKEVYYLVYLGAVRLDLASKTLIDIYQDNRAEREKSDGLAAIGLIVLNEQGVPVPETGLSLSSFGWAYGRALMTRLDDLKHWPLAEERLCEGLEEILYPQGNDSSILPLTFETLESAYTWLTQNCALPNDQLIAPRFAVRIERKIGKGAPDSSILNSFYLEDLQKVKEGVSSGHAGDAIKRYLGIKPRDNTLDLLHSEDAPQNITAALRPDLTPSGRWPGSGRHPLVLLQQTAVNLAFQELKDTGVFSVNGPPGTGKTTLLRDIVAGIIIKRAQAMAKFDDPASAFAHADKFESGKYTRHMYRLDESLCGHEIIVASSNNNAVENVTKELPLSKEIADDMPDLRYFKVLSDALSGGEDSTWGTIAAVLGNATNRGDFSSTAWWDKQVGLQSYFKSIIEPESVPQDPNRIADIVAHEDPPEGLGEALERWETARKEFNQALANSEKMTVFVQKGFDAQARIDVLLPILNNAENVEETCLFELKQAEEALAQATKSLSEIDDFSQREQDHERISEKLKPGLLRRLFKWGEWKDWKANHAAILKKLYQLQQEYAAAYTDLKTKGAQKEKAEKALKKAQSDINKIKHKMEADQRIIDDVKPFCGDQLLSASFWKKSHRERQTFPPNFTNAAHRLRDDVFVAAMKLHKAFIDASCKKLRHNLRLFFSEIGGDKIPPEKRYLLPHIWSSIFLITPVVSTTFASVGRMLKDLPPESIGWLLIDESGQAKPQEAVGAIYRAKRVMPVGDPLQVEPVVTLPQPLIEGLSRHMGVNPDHWMAPLASVQTVADRSNSYGATIERDDGEIRIGAPLLVHRRCDDPMFSISNELAYAGMMVHATISKQSPIIDCLGDSQWFDIRGSAQDKWCPEEGEQVVNMILRALDELRNLPDIYVISPFRIVADNMSKLLNRHKHDLESRGINDPYKWIKERVGTVHTFQGKEADAVILLLGAPSPEQNGARNWATSQVNLLNVAVSRAKRNLYVVGNKELWGNSGNMKIVRANIGKST